MRYSPEGIYAPHGVESPIQLLSAIGLISHDGISRDMKIGSPQEQAFKYEVVRSNILKVRHLRKMVREAFPEQMIEQITISDLAGAISYYIITQLIRDTDLDILKRASINSPSVSGCLYCHKPPDFIDNKLWTISFGGLETEISTPTLFGTSSLESYSHNGRYKSLSELLQRHPADVKSYSPSTNPIKQDEVLEFLMSLKTNYVVQ